MQKKSTSFFPIILTKQKEYFTKCVIQDHYEIENFSIIICKKEYFILKKIISDFFERWSEFECNFLTLNLIDFLVFKFKF